jgi:hypothetical protein
MYATWVGCHEQVTGFHNCYYKSFSCKEEAIASYLEFIGQSDVPLVQYDPIVGAHAVFNNMLCPNHRLGPVYDYSRSPCVN